MSYSTGAFWLRLLFRTRRVGCRYHSPARLRIPLEATPMVREAGGRQTIQGWDSLSSRLSQSLTLGSDTRGRHPLNPTDCEIV